MARLVHRLLGKIKITEQADQSFQDSSRIHAIKRVEQFAYLLGECSDMTTTVANQQPRINLANRGQCWQIEAKCPGRDSEIWTTERFLG
jgi:hypothetical protein